MRGSTEKMKGYICQLMIISREYTEKFQGLKETEHGIRKLDLQSYIEVRSGTNMT